MNPLDGFFTLDTRLDIYFPKEEFTYFFPECRPEEYEQLFCEQILNLFSITKSLDWEYIFRVTGSVPGGPEKTLRVFSRVIANHELLHFNAIPSNNLGIYHKFGFKIVKCDEGYRVYGLIKIYFPKSTPKDQKDSIFYDILVAPFLTEGPKLSAMDLKRAKAIEKSRGGRFSRLLRHLQES